MKISEKQLQDMLLRGHVRIASEAPVLRHARPIIGRSATAVSARKIAKLRPAKAMPHDILWNHLIDRHGDAIYREFPAGVAGRRFRIDIAAPFAGLAIEVDGWAHHGQRLGDFTKDRTRQNLLVQTGWRILRFTAGQIRKEIDTVANSIATALQGTHQTQHLPESIFTRFDAAQAILRRPNAILCQQRLSEHLLIDQALAGSILNCLRLSGRCHVTDWARGNNGKLNPVYAWGKMADTEKPAKQRN